MTKFMLVLHLCSVVAGKCTDATYTGLMFDDHYTCALEATEWVMRLLKTRKR